MAGYDLEQKAADVLYNGRPRGEFELILPHEFGSSEELKKYGTPKTFVGKGEVLVLDAEAELDSTFFETCDTAAKREAFILVNDIPRSALQAGMVFSKFPVGKICAPLARLPESQAELTAALCEPLTRRFPVPPGISFAEGELAQNIFAWEGQQYAHHEIFVIAQRVLGMTVRPGSKAKLYGVIDKLFLDVLEELSIHGILFTRASLSAHLPVELEQSLRRCGILTVALPMPATGVAWGLSAAKVLQF
eukprot:m51a1_g10789 hypothetical protein (248) ;mRNA; f:13009-15765